MKIRAITTEGLTDKDWVSVVEGFNETFGADKTVAELKKYYFSKCQGNSFHALAMNERDEVVGSTTIVPYRYSDGAGRVFFAGLSGGSYILKKYRRRETLFSEMYIALRKLALSCGVEVVLGVPNNMSYPYLTKVLPFRHLCDLDYYVLPVRMSNLPGMPSVRLLDSCLLGIVHIWVLLSRAVDDILPFRKGNREFRIVKDELFYQQRFDTRYEYYQDDSYRLWYRIVEEEGFVVAYVLEFLECGKRTRKALVKICKLLFGRKEIDVIAFVGNLDFRCPALVKLPKRMAPRQFHLVADVLKDDKTLQESFLRREAWSFSLMNFDVR